jgi:hypothetical protein
MFFVKQTFLSIYSSIQHRKVVPWMRKTEYISTEFNRYGIGQTGLDRPDTKIGYGMKKRIKDEQFEYKDRASQIAAIERTFADAKRKIKKHYIKPGVTAVEEFSIFPDFEVKNNRTGCTILLIFSYGNFHLRKSYLMLIHFHTLKSIEMRN